MKKIMALLVLIQTFVSIGYCGKDSGAEGCETTPNSHWCLYPNGEVEWIPVEMKYRGVPIVVPIPVPVVAVWDSGLVECKGSYSRLSGGTGDYIAGGGSCGTRTFEPPFACVRTWSAVEKCGSAQAALTNNPE